MQKREIRKKVLISCHWQQTTLKQEVNTLDKLVVEYELEFAMKQAHKVVYVVWVANKTWVE